MAGDGIPVINPKELDVSAMVVANASANVTISNIGPAAIGTATISAWLKVRNQGVDYFIPMWT